MTSKDMTSWRKPLDTAIKKELKGYILIVQDWCKGCGFCVEFCPNDVLALSESLNKKGYHPHIVKPGKLVDCDNCELCQLICPDFAIYCLSKKEFERLKAEKYQKSSANTVQKSDPAS